MKETRVIHVKDMHHHPDAVYIGRAMPRQGLKGSRFANPYKIGPDGTRTEVIQKYRELVGDLAPMEVRALRQLSGKPLACWCRRAGDERTDANTCHGDVLVELLKQLEEAT